MAIGMQNFYNHSEYFKCQKIGLFAKTYNIKCKCGEIIGRNKVFRIFKRLGIFNKDNLPAQAYIHCFKLFYKKHEQGEDGFVKPVVLIKSEYEEFLAKKITNFVENHCVCESKKVNSSGNFNVSTVQNEKIKCGSPLDFNQEQAREWIESLHPMFKSSYFATKVREKWGWD